MSKQSFFAGVSLEDYGIGAVADGAHGEVSIEEVDASLEALAFEGNLIGAGVSRLAFLEAGMESNEEEVNEVAASIIEFACESLVETLGADAVAAMNVQVAALEAEEEEEPAEGEEKKPSYASKVKSAVGAAFGKMVGYLKTASAWIAGKLAPLRDWIASSQKKTIAKLEKFAETMEGEVEVKLPQDPSELKSALGAIKDIVESKDITKVKGLHSDILVGKRKFTLSETFATEISDSGAGDEEVTLKVSKAGVESMIATLKDVDSLTGTFYKNIEALKKSNAALTKTAEGEEAPSEDEKAKIDAAFKSNKAMIAFSAQVFKAIVAYLASIAKKVVSGK